MLRWYNGPIMTTDNTSGQTDSVPAASGQQPLTAPGTIQSYGFSPVGHQGSIGQNSVSGEQSLLQKGGVQATGPAGMVQSPQSPQTGLGTMPSIADDTDLIEKEWVLKAKEIVERTHDDPYKQNNAIHQLKADYMKKRYSKDIKLSNG